MDTENERVNVAESLGVITSERDPEQVISESRLLSENAIPIGATVGHTYATRFADGVRAQQTIHSDWKEAIKEFTSVGAYEGADDQNAAPEENVIRTTVETLVDFSYMRNPSAEISSQDEKGQPLAALLGAALPVLMNKKANLGLNLRPKVVKQIINAHFTNFGVLKLGYQPKKGSVEQALETLEAVQQLIKVEKDPETANRYYELLDILQRELEMRREFGMSVSVINPFNIIADPSATETDTSDSKWLMERDQLDEAYIKAEYMKMDENSGTLVYRYDERIGYEAEKRDNPEATATATVMEEIFPDLDVDQASLRLKNKLPVVWVYDRVTRLVILYLEGRWETPLWVYKDELKLSRFFPHFILSFSSPINSITQRGEVSHYIRFQQEINNINKQASAARKAAFSIILYDSNTVDSKEVDRVLKEVTRSTGELKAIGIKLKDKDKGVDGMLAPFKMPALQFMEMFDKSGLKEAITSASRVGDAMRGQQFKVNTNTTAVNTYKEQAQTRLEGLTDKIEASVEDLLWSVCEIMVSQFTMEEMQMLVSTKAAEDFVQMSVRDFNLQHSLTIAAGSTEKPTTERKKEEAAGIIQMLGQFGSAAPGTVLSIVSRLLRSAFSRELVTDNDLKLLKEESSAAMQKGVSTGGEQGGPEGPQPPQPTPPQV
jgi:DNA-binding PadR family transcriptional regulator